mmetsp:Transcript_72404/g.183217  ORF Transcript_72404/g.183217 Transcript_72404/m.183217 type:complete len:474 (-) Transcript_72404:173-1594(-)|eukprot:CAMPEP_0183396906 /NCGR_PEP_ID=MMETSP0370-20130417/10257_1 /TAXON_ID=268820 /ORGANISM="Peridinium aciculiferum, Strain PAER-2" /LENGTH=473 /DNA_ID=CAMNT_0025577721 /DNA_START=12 /DNA_END=1433 /DNA_ORIENTATION=-
MEPRPLYLIVAAATAASASLADDVDASGQREYAQGSWSEAFFRPREVKIDSVGMVNEETAYVATRSGIKALQEGHLTPLVEVIDEEIKAFHLCHHRHSIFYEVLSRDGGALSVYEYSLSVREKSLVTQFQDEMPATALACVDEWLLRTSPEHFRALHVATGTASELRRFRQEPEPSDAVSSLSVAYAADVVDRAEVFAAVPGNGTIVRIHLQHDGEHRLTERVSEVALHAGDGSDGISSSAHAPEHVLWSRGELLFTDGCSLRSLAPDSGRVRTLLGRAPGAADCHHPANETLEPAPWATRLSRPRALAAADEGTGHTSVLLLTEAQVILVSDQPNTCATSSANDDESHCSAENSHCGWAEGADPEQRLCFECGELERWAAKLQPPADPCSLELAPRVGTRYQLVGCGCVPPPPISGGGDDAGTIQAILAVLLVITVLVCGVMWKRRSRRAAALQELYGIDTVEFHTFKDNES